jgi:hypothetical protein
MAGAIWGLVTVAASGLFVVAWHGGAWVGAGLALVAGAVGLSMAVRLR